MIFTHEIALSQLVMLFEYSPILRVDLLHVPDCICMHFNRIGRGRNHVVAIMALHVILLQCESGLLRGMVELHG